MVDYTARPSARARGYNWRWEKARLAYLRRHPLCIMCQKQGITTQADVVDHIIPHKGNMQLFWDQANWQSLCFTHHNQDKQRMDRGSKPRQQVGEDGWPIEG